MKQARTIGWALVLALGVAAAPVDAQGKGKEKDKGKKERTEEVRRERDDRRDDRRYDDRYERDGRRKGVPPGWCIGRGNPHNTRENCGDRGERYDPRYDDRRDSRNDRYDDRDRNDRGSYEERHEYYHRVHDQECRARAAERPLDIRWQVQVRAECKAEHDRWHARNEPGTYERPILQRRPGS